LFYNLQFSFNEKCGPFWHIVLEKLVLYFLPFSLLGKKTDFSSTSTYVSGYNIK